MTRHFDNFAQLSASIARTSHAFQEEVKGLIEYHVGEIEIEAIRAAPGPGSNIATEHGPESLADIDKGKSWTPISQAIGYTIDPKGYSGQVFVEKSAGEVAVWVEMGTGQSARSYLATVPAEWRDIAQKYYINGKGTILNQPYILPAFLKHQIECVNDLKKALKDMTL